MITKKYELVQTGLHFWELYFLDNEFNSWIFIKKFNNNTSIKNIYDFIKNNNHSYDNILVKFIFQR